MTRDTLHLIGNAHIDPVWLWQWQEGFQEVKASFRSALDRIAEYDDFIFTSSSAAFYEWVERNDPAMFAEIQQRVQEGRWEITGGWWIQPDCNIPSGESFARQGLYAQRYFQSRFGRTATVGYNVDSFGHNGMLPQILKLSGLDSYIFMRPDHREMALPARIFWWTSADGSRVLACRLPYPYNSDAAAIARHVEYCAAEIAGPARHMVCFYGVGNHGGGPTKETIDALLAMQQDSTLPDLRFSTPERFFAEASAAGDRHPVVQEDLQHHASGCYAAHSGVKRWNRQAENRLLAAEKYAAMAEVMAGQPYPADELTQAWKNVLFNQFHDILAGTSLEAAYDDAQVSYGEAISIAGRALNYAVQSLSWRIGIGPEAQMRPVVVFNPHAWPITANVEVEIRDGRPQRLVDEQGVELPLQPVQSHASARRCQRLAFTAALPAFGYRTYRLYGLEGTYELAAPVAAVDGVIENQALRLEIDPATGAIARLYDKRHNVDVFAGPAALPVVIADDSDTWSHDVFRFDQVVGAFAPVGIRLMEHGPVRSTLRVESVYGDSRLFQDFTLVQGLERVDVAVRVDWREQFKLLKLRFPVRLQNSQATYEIPFGHIVRPADGAEEPGQNWIDLSGLAEGGAPYGVSLINDAKYSYDIHDNVLGLTVLRSPIYAHHVPLVPDPERDYAFIDQGVQTFRYQIVPHGGDWRDGDVVRQGLALNQPPLVLIESYHPAGDLPQVYSFLQVDAETVAVTAVKRAEAGEALIVRGYETAGKAVTATFTLPAMQRSFTATFAPYTIKTFSVPYDAGQPVVEVDLLERPMGLTST